MKWITHISGALRTAALSILLCVVLYTFVIWIIGQVFFPVSANGSLVQSVSGKYVGSRLIGQKFTAGKYFHSRPSAAGYDGAKAAGSNLSPTSPALAQRAKKVIQKYGAHNLSPVPADMVTASGSGLDPHITLAAAKYQLPRVARARNMSEKALEKIVKSHVEYPGDIVRSEPIINVLLLNLALDGQKK